MARAGSRSPRHTRSSRVELARTEVAPRISGRVRKPATPGSRSPLRIYPTMMEIYARTLQCGSPPQDAACPGLPPACGQGGRASAALPSPPAAREAPLSPGIMKVSWKYRGS